MASHYSTLQVRQALKRLGFSDNEIKVLIFLFYTKKANAKEISRDTAIAFTSVQYCLSNLTARELVKIKPEAEDVFEIVSEKEFFEWIDNAKQEHDMIYERSKEEINSFFKIVQKKSWKPEVRYFEGRDGIIEIYEDMLETGEDIYGWTDLEEIYKTFGDYTNKFIEKRIEKNIKTHAIKPKTKESIIDAKDKSRNREIKLLENFAVDGEIRIYGNKVALITFDENKPVGFVFEGSVIVNLFKNIFKSYWEKQN